MARIRLYKGDITELDTDAIVNAANSTLRMGAGVAGAIKRRGGDQIEREALAKGPIEVGEAIATGAGKLQARYVIHAASMGPDLITDEEKIRAATRNSLLLADELALRSVALPALGTGVGGYPTREAARIMVDEVLAHLERGTGLELIVFALFSTPTYEAFQEELSSRALPAGASLER
ncbi:MAG: macro domain-containing protein [Anaerolineae bacterium]